MGDIVLKDIDSKLQARIQAVADAHGWDLPRALNHLLELGLSAARAKPAPEWDSGEEAALSKAIAALEEVPDDPGFALIGRASTNGSGD